MANTPLKAIKAWCAECSGDEHPRKCVSCKCPLFPFRLGKNTLLKPRKLSDKQKQQLMENLQKKKRCLENGKKEN